MTDTADSLADIASVPPALPAAVPGEQAAEQELTALTAPLAAASSTLAATVQLAAAALMTTDGTGLRLAASPAAGGRAVAAGCAFLLAARLAAAPLARRRQQPADGGEPGWVAAAAVHQRSLPGWVPAATLAAAARYLPALAASRGQERAFLYLGRCAGPGRCSRVCRSAGAWLPGGQLMVVLGEHTAAVPAAAAVSLAHELGHVTGWTYRAFLILHSARNAGGWGWAVAGLAGAAYGWPGVLAAAVVFQAVCLLALWVVEAACDLRAARSEGRTASLRAFGYIAAATAAGRAGIPRWRRAAGGALRGAAGPSHPPLWLRTALIRNIPARWLSARP